MRKPKKKVNNDTVDVADDIESKNANQEPFYYEEIPQDKGPENQVMNPVMREPSRGEEEEADEEASSSLTGKNPFLLWGIAIVSLVGLIYGGNLFLDSAKNLARAWGMSEAVIAITIVAVGTSLPELVTAVIAASKKNPQLALGNVIGSNLFNLMFILGTASTVKPLEFRDINIWDYAVMFVSAIMLYVVVLTFKKDKFDRIEGVIFFGAYVAYTVYLLLR